MQADIEKKLDAGYIAYVPDGVKFRRKRRFHRPLQEKRIKQLEADYDFRIPDEFRAFLLTSNGGYPDPGFVSIPGHPHIENVDVASILGLDCDPGDNIRFYIAETSPALPRSHFPIAAGRDLFTIAMKRKKGAVFFWDLEQIDVDDVDENGDYQLSESEGFLLASSFEEFMTRLAVYPNDKSVQGIRSPGSAAKQKAAKKKTKR